MKKWDLQKYKADSIKYKTRTEWARKSPAAYSSCLRAGLLDECCQHMSIVKKPNGYWTKERCYDEAKKFNHRSEFQRKSQTAYSNACKQGFIDEICKHMEMLIKPNGYWTKEKCYDEAKKFNHRSEFQRNSSSAYQTAYRQNFLEEICEHMTPIGNFCHRMVYVYEFSDKSVYSGLTYNSSERHKNHFDINHSSSVREHIEKTGTQPVYKAISDYIEVQEAQKLEGVILEHYKQNGWTILNKVKTGGIGGCVSKLTKEVCQNESLKYKSKREFELNCSSCYRKARKSGWLNEICSHMVPLVKPKGYWNEQHCWEVALEYNSKSEFQRNCGSAYNSARKQGFLDKICSHMPRLHKPKSYWTKERCIEESFRFNNKSDFKRKTRWAFRVAFENGWLEDICLKRNWSKYQLS